MLSWQYIFSKHRLMLQYWKWNESFPHLIWEEKKFSDVERSLPTSTEAKEKGNLFLDRRGLLNLSPAQCRMSYLLPCWNVSLAHHIKLDTLWRLVTKVETKLINFWPILPVSKLMPSGSKLRNWRWGTTSLEILNMDGSLPASNQTGKVRPIFWLLNICSAQRIMP